ncbi:DNA-binding transcriptional ArsR family regulator [Natranaerovirga pectinivora]|uniref:DNA-binding transcriptional ArsR family regulator n=1 Tax=Natranaerovirga pectinivora TaxID=682400 RepID=A0A4R3MN66_9FIRM|nr:autorepressor SdpR family transcription factor [Natranaerovirga pectinivora]TCT14642.1 DNA-binding transcriptional ArsR family regulator [Natranaerovirga pectinivora]
MNDVFKALSDPTRRKILELLYEKDLTAGDIAEEFDISKPSISHHLTILKNAELVFTERQGQNIIYTLNTTVFQSIIKWFFDLTGKDDNNEEE